MKKADLPTFSVRLGELFVQRGVTQQQVTTATGVAQSTISQYLRGMRTTPRVEEVLALAAYFDVSVEWLFGAQDQSTEHESHSFPEKDDPRLIEVKEIANAIEKQVAALQAILRGHKDRKQKGRVARPPKSDQ